MMAAAQRTSGSRYRISGYATLVDEWDWEKNGDVTPDDVTAGSARRIWWRCPRGPDHRWRASPNNRTANETGCPYCANRRVSVTNSLATRHVEIALQWHPTKNGGVGPEDVVETSTRKCWWRCAHDPAHEWKASVRDRVRFRTDCPYCANRRACDSNSLQRLHPALSAEWDATGNGGLTPADVVPGSPRVVWWRCLNEPSHRWRASIVNRVARASGCPHCARAQSTSSNAA